jgi:hypothetical protein
MEIDKFRLNKKCLVLSLLLAALLGLLASNFGGLWGLVVCSGAVGIYTLAICLLILLVAVSLGSSYVAKQSGEEAFINVVLTVWIYGMIFLAIVLLSVGQGYSCPINPNFNCIGQPGFSCFSPAISQNGILSITLGGGSGATGIENFAGLACVSSSNSIISTNRLGALNLEYQSVIANKTWPSRGTISVNGLQCYPATGPTLGMLSHKGSVFKGEIWLTYYSSNTTPNATEHVEVATFAVRSNS